MIQPTDYMEFTDAEVGSIVAENWGDGIGITAEEFQAITSIGTTFKGNTEITQFPELAQTSVTELGYQAFQGCSALADIGLSKIVKLGDSAFRECNALVNVTGLDKVQTIENAAFSRCAALECVGNLASVTNIGGYEFFNCTNLKAITIGASTPPTITANTFDNTPSSLKIYVPDEAVSAYKSASNWSAQASKIHPISEYVEPET